MLADFVPFSLCFFMEGYLHTYYFSLCVQVGHQAICTDFMQKSMFVHLQMISQKLNNRSEIL